MNLLRFTDWIKLISFRNAFKFSRNEFELYNINVFHKCNFVLLWKEKEKLKFLATFDHFYPHCSEKWRLHFCIEWIKAKKLIDLSSWNPFFQLNLSYLKVWITIKPNNKLGRKWVIFHLIVLSGRATFQFMTENKANETNVLMKWIIFGGKNALKLVWATTTTAADFRYWSWATTIFTTVWMDGRNIS